MQIKELLESLLFKEKDFVEPKEDGKREINFDLADDLIFFMENDDTVHRRFVFPAVDDFIKLKKNNGSPKPSVFKEAARHSYKQYIKKFPIRELPDEISEDILKQVCEKMYEEISKQIEEGKHKD
jgi:hypothetical protein